MYENRAKFMEMTAECGADEELRGLIWEALQSTRPKLDKSNGSGTLRDKMSAALNQVPTLAEFSAVLKKELVAKQQG